MGAQYRCDNEKRRLAVREHPTLNGIDYLEVLDEVARELGSSPRQRTLLVHAFKPVPAGFDKANVRIEGGVRIAPIRVVWAFRADSIPTALLSAPEQVYFALLPDADRVFVVRTDVAGDFSTYRLFLSDPALPPGFDPPLSEVTFSFKVECPTPFDCEPPGARTLRSAPAPRIDYLARDYASFRRLMLDRLAVTMPDWRERNPADVGVTLVELLAYSADHLSYFQDAVATEAYLGTARRRVSVRRHARLLDYPMHDGANARAWVSLEVASGGGADGATLPGPTDTTPGTLLLTGLDEKRGGLHPDQVAAALVAGAMPFETLHDVALRAAHNALRFYTWGDEDCCLPRGATRATLDNRGDALQALRAGDVLILAEVRGPATGLEADADPSHRHAVRLTRVQFKEDALFLESPGQALRVVDVAWSEEDALPFPLCLKEVGTLAAPAVKQPVSVAWGNVVLADHGLTIEDEALAPLPSHAPYRPQLSRGPLTQQGHVRDASGSRVRFDPQRPAAAALRWDLKDLIPAIWLADPAMPGVRWEPRRDLLESDRFAADFAVELEDDGRATLRFGDGVLGRTPDPGLRATYRVGNGAAGNVGAGAIARVATALPGITDVRNPLPARGGLDPEPIEQVRLQAPQAFRTQERAVTEADYAAAAERHPDVQRAVAHRRWTGSWYTMFITVDRLGGRPVDAPFKQELRAFLDRFRLAGHDLEIDSPRYAPLDLALSLCVAPGYFQSDVLEALLEVFSNRELPGGRRGFFHPDNFTFGQPVYLSQVVRAAMEVPGVAWVDTSDAAPLRRFQRFAMKPADELAHGLIPLARLEIARLDNDPSFPENGRLEFNLRGGL